MFPERYVLVILTGRFSLVRSYCCFQKYITDRNFALMINDIHVEKGRKCENTQPPNSRN